MKNHIVRLTIIMFLALVPVSALIAGTGLPEVPPQEAGLLPEQLELMESAVETLIDQQRIPGAVTLIARQGKVAHSSAQGFMDVDAGTKMRPDAIFRIYSMTKPTVSVAIMMLYEEGLLSLTDPIVSFIPELENLAVYISGEGPTMKTEPLKRPITVRDLLTHTSGFTSKGQGSTPLHRMYRSKGIMPGSAELSSQLTDAKPSESLDKLVNRLSTVPLLRQPGEQFGYGVSTDLLGLIVERVSGHGLDAFLTERIFKPLGMNDTAFFVPESKVDRFAALYDHNDDGNIELFSSARDSRFMVKPSLFSGGAGLVSTAADYVRFCQMLLNGGALEGVQILRSDTVDLMTQNHLADSEVIYGRGGLGFGLGFAVTFDQSLSDDIGSNGTYAWGGAASTVFWIDPQEELIVVAMTQVINAKEFMFNDFLQPLVYRAIAD